MLLFGLKFGIMPYREDGNIHGIDMNELWGNKRELFWELFEEKVFKKKLDLSKELKDLINKMTWVEEPSKRLSAEECLNHEWLKGPTYEKNEFLNIFGAAK
mmetsp:Transcript_24441/g.21623  ORF Transcript_24441/g.21623 Transcript_24441/m.21623 type:complete len:101 (+) Transcript_24441:704-1006(+)